MGTICLSVVPELRCLGLSHTEGAILLVGPAIAFLSALLFIFFRRNHGRIHLLLASESIVFFILAVLDYAAHYDASISTSKSTFKAVDILIGIASTIVVSLYIVFLLLYVRLALLPDLPARLRRLCTPFFALLIPAILVLHASSSFAGIHYVTIPGSPPLAGAGFRTPKDHTTHTFLSALALALSTSYQAAAFLLTLYRLLRSLSAQRTLEERRETDEHAYRFRGLAWLCVGLKLGAVESVLGYAEAGFGRAVSRLILRAVSRTVLMVGVAKGVDTLEDFTFFTKRAPGTLRGRIGHPRHSTFLHLAGSDLPDAEKSLPPARTPIAARYSLWTPPTQHLPSTQDAPQADHRLTFTSGGGFAPPAAPALVQLHTRESRRPSSLSQLSRLAGFRRSLFTPTSAGSPFPALTPASPSAPSLPARRAAPAPHPLARAHTADGSFARRPSVLVLYAEDGRSAPRLHVRFSGVEFPSPTGLMQGADMDAGRAAVEKGRAARPATMPARALERDEDDDQAVFRKGHAQRASASMAAMKDSPLSALFPRAHQAPTPPSHAREPTRAPTDAHYPSGLSTRSSRSPADFLRTLAARFPPAPPLRASRLARLGAGADVSPFGDLPSASTDAGFGGPPSASTDASFGELQSGKGLVRVGEATRARYGSAALRSGMSAYFVPAGVRTDGGGARAARESAEPQSGLSSAGWGTFGVRTDAGHSPVSPPPVAVQRPPSVGVPFTVADEQDGVQVKMVGSAPWKMTPPPTPPRTREGSMTAEKVLVAVGAQDGRRAEWGE